MRYIANVKPAVENTLTIPYALPALLGVNSVLLVVLDGAGLIPSWVKLAAAMFLEF